MTSANLFDPELILSPIDGDWQTGQDVRLDPSPTSTYQTIKIARNSARAAERNSIHDGNTSEADEHWRTIKNNAPDLLTNQSKDLEVACWYTEALLRSNGFQGLRDGFLLIHGLIERFWANLYPLPDEDGMETRVACLAGLNGEGAEGVLIAPIRKTIITEGSSCGPFTYWEYQQALECQKLPDEKAKQAKIDKLGFSIDSIETAVRESSNEFFENIRGDLIEAIDLFKKTGQLLDEHCGTYDAPPTRTIIEVLEDCLGAISHLGRDKFLVMDEVPVEQSQDEQSGAGEGQAAPAQPAAANYLANRDAAFKQLIEISEFFRKTEPHSPVSYVLQKAVKWGHMPLNELIQELIPDSSSRNHYSELTGVLSDDD